jgi:two-component system chemotaxis response regulator CheB
MEVLVVEDSSVVRTYLKHVLDRDNGLEVRMVTTGEAALEAVNQQQPDVIVMDLHLPGISGIEAIHRIMAEHPCPIVVLSGELTRSDVDLTFQSLKAGAVKVVTKPTGMEPEEVDRFAQRFIRTLRVMSQVKLVKHSPERVLQLQEQREDRSLDSTAEPAGHQIRPEVIVIGASTGGPAVIQKLLMGLPADFCIPIIIAQHISDGFEQGFVDWLRTSTGKNVVLGSSGDLIQERTIYSAPKAANIGVDLGNRIRLVPERGPQLTPNVDLLFSSVAEVYGPHALAILLTGMGTDGVEGMKALDQVGAQCWVQDPKTAVVQSMPRSVLISGVDALSLAPDQIVTQLSLLEKKEAIGS